MIVVFSVLSINMYLLIGAVLFLYNIRYYGYRMEYFGVFVDEIGESLGSCF